MARNWQEMVCVLVCDKLMRTRGVYQINALTRAHLNRCDLWLNWWRTVCVCVFVSMCVCDNMSVCLCACLRVYV